MPAARTRVRSCQTTTLRSEDTKEQLLTLQLFVPSSSAAERAETADELLEVDRPAAAVKDISLDALQPNDMPQK